LEEPLTRYFRSRPGESPAVFVEEDEQWRGYAANGSLQTSTGPLPDAIRSHTEEIAHEEAVTLIAAWREHARELKKRSGGGAAAASAGGHAAAPETIGLSPAPGGAATKAADDSQTVFGTFGPQPLRPSHRWVYVTGAAVVLVVLVILAALAFTGHLRGGASAATTSTAGANTVVSGGPVASKDVAAKVGAQVISRQLLEQKVADFKAEYGAQVPDPKTDGDQYKVFQQDVLDYLVAYELASQKAAALGVAVSETDVQAQMAIILKVSCGGDQVKFDSSIKDQGLTLEQFKRFYKESMVFQRVYEAVTKGVTASSGVTDTTALEAGQKQAWRKWLSQERATVGVTYANGWTAPENAGKLTP
jgi:hypothetical protein